jgi:hypothetical protein
MAGTSEASSGRAARGNFLSGPAQDLHQTDSESGHKKGRLPCMERLLRYDMMLEVNGVLRSQDVRVELDREVYPGETINMHERNWLVTEVTAAKPNHGLDRRCAGRAGHGLGLPSIAQELGCGRAHVAGRSLGRTYPDVSLLGTISNT